MFRVECKMLFLVNLTQALAFGKSFSTFCHFEWKCGNREVSDSC